MKALLASVSLIALVTSAGAADIAVKAPAMHPAPLSWSGFYVGIAGGWTSGRWSGDLTYDPGTGPFPVFNPSHRTISGNGGIFGGHIGFNHQIGMMVWGLEADASWTNFKGSGMFDANLNGADGYHWQIDNKLNWLATVRGRLGITITPNLLAYGTGGVAFGQTESNEIVTADARQGFIPTATTALATAKDNRVGWAAGGGLEYMLTGTWSIRAEYLFADLGHGDNNFVGTAYPSSPPCKGAPAVGCSFPHTTDSFPGGLNLHIIRAGISARF